MFAKSDSAASQLFIVVYLLAYSWFYDVTDTHCFLLQTVVKWEPLRFIVLRLLPLCRPTKQGLRVALYPETLIIYASRRLFIEETKLLK